MIVENFMEKVREKLSLEIKTSFGWRPVPGWEAAAPGSRCGNEDACAAGRELFLALLSKRCLLGEWAESWIGGSKFLLQGNRKMVTHRTELRILAHYFENSGV